MVLFIDVIAGGVGFKANSLLVVPAATPLVLGGKSLVAVLFGGSFVEAGKVVFLLAISSGSVAIGALYSSRGYANEKHYTWMKLSVSILAVAMFLLLVPIVGLMGAVIAQASVQMAATMVFAAAVAFVGFLALDRLARGFEFS